MSIMSLRCGGRGDLAIKASNIVQSKAQKEYFTVRGNNVNRISRFEANDLTSGRRKAFARNVKFCLYRFLSNYIQQCQVCKEVFVYV